ncbi:MAG: hypothetical protein IVW57_02775 [Ktedonobacterales bacterium]|nr:hypothetical protein [Ktedonobacterales bacterium]
MYPQQRLSPSRRDTVPTAAYAEMLQVRSYEVGRDGRAHPATILRYLEHLATRASAALGFDHHWYEQQGTAWVVREMSLLLGDPPGIDASLRMATWLSEFRRVQAYREYAIWDAESGRRIARARGRWACIDQRTGLPVRVPDRLIEACPIFNVRPRHRSVAVPPALLSQRPPQTLRLSARRYEADSQRHINNCVYGDWLEEALADALGEDMAAPETRRPRCYHIEYVRPAWPGDEGILSTSWAWHHSRRLIVSQEITAVTDGALLVRAHSEHLRVPSHAKR